MLELYSEARIEYGSDFPCCDLDACAVDIRDRTSTPEEESLDGSSAASHEGICDEITRRGQKANEIFGNLRDEIPREPVKGMNRPLRSRCPRKIPVDASYKPKQL